MTPEHAPRTYYEIVQVHPAAPLELITAAYWRLTGDLQTRRTTDPEAGAELFFLTQAYQVLADSRQRAAYDLALGVQPEPLVPQRPPRLGKRLFGRSRGRQVAARPVGYYDVLRVSCSASPGVIQEAYSVLRSYYLRVVRLTGEPSEILDRLDEAYAVTNDPERRRQYDESRASRQATPRAPPAEALSEAPIQPTQVAAASPRAPAVAASAAADGVIHNLAETAGRPNPAQAPDPPPSDGRSPAMPPAGSEKSEPAAGQVEQPAAGAGSAPTSESEEPRLPLPRAILDDHSPGHVEQPAVRPEGRTDIPELSRVGVTAKLRNEIPQPPVQGAQALCAPQFDDPAAPAAETIPDAAVGRPVEQPAGAESEPAQESEQRDLPATPAGIAGPSALQSGPDEAAGPPQPHVETEAPEATEAPPDLETAQDHLAAEQAPETVEAQAPAGTGSPRRALQALTTGAGGILNSVGRQLSNLSRKETQQAQEVMSRRALGREEKQTVEESMLQRLGRDSENGSGQAHSRNGVSGRLAVIEGPGSGATFHIAHFPLTLGGDADCDVSLPGLAPRQARILFRDGRFVVFKLAQLEPSAGVAANLWQVVESGDQVSLGPYKLQLTAVAGADQSPPAAPSTIDT